jgi:hypothetical protein
MTAITSNNRTSVLVASQLPQFVREDHNNFVQFIQSYYKFLEDSNYKKAVRSNLSVSTAVGPAGAYQNTDTVYLSSTIATSNVPLSNGAKVSIDGTITFAKGVVQSATSFKVDPPVPIRIVQGDFYIYENRTSSSNNQLMEVTKNWNRYLDIDVATTDNQQIRQKLYDNFIKVLPKSLVADKTLIAKHAKDFYRSKGSENSVKFLLRALYNTESDFYYPKQDILRASDGKWYIEKIIRISDTMVNNVSNSMVDTEFVGKQITGMSSQAQAIVEGVNVYYKNGRLVTELLISNTNKPFLSNEKIFAYYQDSELGITKFASATVFGGQIIDVQITNGGTGYLEGMVIPVIPTDNTGNGARIIVSKVSRGGINRIFVGSGDQLNLPQFGGAGYKVDDLILVSGGGGTGALAGVESVWDNNFYHPNTYNLTSTTLADVADYNINDFYDVVPNLTVAFGTTVANTVVANAVSYWTYGPTGPIKFCYVLNEGQDYGLSIPNFSVQANTRIKNLGILGKMSIVNGGLNYTIGDTIEFINKPNFSFGTGATANVTNVAANGKITEVKFQKMDGHLIGGSGYNQDYLPTCNVRSVTGNGANIVVNNILGTGGSFTFTTESLGIIKAIRILDGGSAYVSTPILNLTGLGDGKAQAKATIITGIYSYPGRYINDDGFLSSKNRLQDRDYYQNFSYVIKSKASINRYRPLLKSLTHPAGMKMFGRYEIIDTEPATMNVSQAFDSSNTATVSNTGLRLHLDSANTIDSLTGLGYEYTIYNQENNMHIFTSNGSNGIATDLTAYYHPTTWVNLEDKGYIGSILNGAEINQETGVLSFDGTNDYAYFPANPNLDLGTLSIEIWFSPFSLYQNGYLIEKGFKNQQYGILMQTIDPNLNRKNIITAGQSFIDSELIWRANVDGFSRDMVKVRSSQFLKLRWNHVATTFTSGAQTMYINGKFAGANTIVGNMASPPAGISIATSGPISGTIPTRNYYFEGSISIVRIYNRVLSPTEITKNYNRDRGRFGL